MVGAGSEIYLKGTEEKEASIPSVRAFITFGNWTPDHTQKPRTGRFYPTAP
jgi:hypothetical protein